MRFKLSLKKPARESGRGLCWNDVILTNRIFKNKVDILNILTRKQQFMRLKRGIKQKETIHPWNIVTVACVLARTLVTSVNKNHSTLTEFWN